MTNQPLPLDHGTETHKSYWDLIRRHPFTAAAIVYLIFNGLRFMLVKDFPEWELVFVLAAKNLRAGANIYILAPQAQEHAYSYPPFMAFLAIPFTFLSAQFGRFIWFLINAACAIIVWTLSWKLSATEEPESPIKATGKRPSDHIIRLLGLLCAIRFMQDNFEHRQTDLVIASLILFGCYYWQNARDIPAATLWGLAAAMKGPPLLFAPYLLWRGRWMAALWLIVLAILVNLLPDLISHPPHGVWLTEWYRQMIKPMGEVGDWHSDIILNQSIAGAARRYFATTWALSPTDVVVTPISGSLAPSTLKHLVYLMEIGLIAISALIMGRPGRMYNDSKQSPTPAMLECSIIITLMLLLSPMSSKPHFCILLLPAYCLARRAVAGRDKIALFSIITCTFLVLVLDRNVLGRPLGNLAMWFGAVMWGTIALWLGAIAALLRPLPVLREGARVIWS